MRIGKAGRNIAFAVYTPWKYLEAVFAIFHWIMSWFVASTVVWLRKDFGERYLGWLNLMFGWTAIGLFTGFGNWALSALSGERPSVLIEYVYLGCVGLGIYHRVIINRKNKAGVQWHSLYSGTSHLERAGFKVSTETLQKWIEPGILIILAWMFRRFHSTPMAAWLFVSGLALALHEQMSSFHVRQDFLDKSDARIEAHFWQSAMAGKPAQETAGFTIAQSNRDLFNSRPDIGNPFDRLSPDLKNIMDDEVPA
jgi:hypothetical protein